MIPTPDGSITMRNVKHPVLGIDETGHMLMMRPEHDYQYPGRNVFEIPHTAQYQTMIMHISMVLVWPLLFVPVWQHLYGVDTQN